MSYEINGDLATKSAHEPYFSSQSVKYILEMGVATGQPHFVASR